MTTTPTEAAAMPFTNLAGDRGAALLRDIALVMQHHGVVQPSGKDKAIAQFIGGTKGCLSIFSTLEMAPDATDTEKQERRWQTARLGVFVEREGKKHKLFDAICSDREALADAHPAAGLAHIPFVPSQFQPAPWSEALGSMAAGLRQLDALTPETTRQQPQPVRWHPT